MDNLQHIIAGCLQNNPRHQNALYDQYYGYGLKIVFRYIYHYDKATDVVNDGFVKVFSRLNHFHCDQPENIGRVLMGWMRTIMIHTAIDRLRSDSFLPEIGVIDDHVWLEDKSQATDQELLYKDLMNQLKQLPPMYRVVFNMYVIDGFTHQEIANQLKVSVGTSKSNLFKARAILQKILRTNDKEADICKM